MIDDYKLARKFPRFVVLMFLALCSLGVTEAAKAAQITCVHRSAERDKCEAILIQGEIVRGDLQRLEAVLDPDTNRRPEDPLSRRNIADTHMIYLHSPGGDVLEAMAIGRLLRRLHLQTEAPKRLGANLANGSLQMFEAGPAQNGWQEACRGPDCVCASACFFVWAGGIRRTGDNLLIHRPRATPAMVRELGIPDTRTALGEIRTRVEGFLREMEIPANVITSALETEPGTLVLADMNPSGTWDYGFLPSIVDSLHDTCRIPSVRERQQLRRLVEEIRSSESRGQPVSPALRQSYNSLSARYFDSERCIWRAIGADAALARSLWKAERSRARFDAAQAEDERIRRENLQARRNQTLSNPVQINIEGFGTVEIHRTFVSLSREEQDRVIMSIVTDLRGGRGEPTLPWRPL
jgi:hypothetical protein